MFTPIRPFLVALVPFALVGFLLTCPAQQAEEPRPAEKPKNAPSAEEIASAWTYALEVVCPPFAHYREEAARRQMQANLRKVASQLDQFDPPMRVGSVDALTVGVPERIAPPSAALAAWKVWSKGDPILATTLRQQDRFTTRYQEGSLVLTVVGTIKEGKAVVGRITTREGADEKRYEAVDKVPEEYRDKVAQMIELSAR